MFTNDLHIGKSNTQFLLLIFYDYLATFNAIDLSFIETFLFLKKKYTLLIFYRGE